MLTELLLGCTQVVLQTVLWVSLLSFVGFSLVVIVDVIDHLGV